jgi:phosphoribosylformylglycinamidine synthase
MGVVKDAAPILTANSATDCASELEGLLEELKKRYATLSHLISQGFIRAAKDVGEGGLGVALAEMCFGREMGIHLESSEAPRVESFFGEGLGSFVLVVDPHHVSAVTTTLSQLRRIGVSMKHPALKWSREGFEISVSKLKNTYEKKGREGFFA